MGKSYIFEMDELQIICIRKFWFEGGKFCSKKKVKIVTNEKKLS